MQSKTTNTTRGGVYSWTKWVAAIFVVLLSMSMSSMTMAMAQPGDADATANQGTNNDDSIAVDDITHTFEGDQDDRDGRPDSDAVTEWMNDVLNGIADDGVENTPGADILAIGLGRWNGAEGAEDVLNGLDEGILQDAIENGLRNFIGEDSLARFDELANALRDGNLGDLIDQFMPGTSADLSLQESITPHTHSDLLASIILSSAADGENVSEATIPYSEIERHPHAPGNNVATYGQLGNPGANENPTNVGSQTANYVKGLFEYQWIVGMENRPEDGKNWWSSVGDWLVGNDDGSQAAGTSNAFESILLGLGIFGATMYDGVSGGLEFLNGAFTQLNLANMFGLTNEGEAADNFVTRWLQNLLDSVGVTASLGSIQFIAAGIIGTVFVFLLMKATVSSNRGAIIRDRGLQTTGIRILTIALTVPFAVIFTSTIDDVTSYGDGEALNQATSINDGLVLDTLSWAAATNLSFDPADKSVGGGYENYAPADGDVAELMSASRARLAREAMNDLEDAGGARDQLTAYSSGDHATVNDYFNMLGNIPSIGVMPAAATNPVTSLRRTVVHSENHPSLGGGRLIFNPYFLASRPQGGETASDRGRNTDEDGSVEQSEETGNEGSAQTVPFATNWPGDSEFQCNTGAASMNCTLVQWNNPVTYIYGANNVKAAPPEHVARDNYIAGSNSVQNRDPATADTPDAEENQVVLDANAVNVAIMNRLAGVEGNSMSTQSTAFLLQSRFNNDVLHYKAVNTSPTAASSGASGADMIGNAFARYTIPNTGPADKAGKIATVSTLWLTAGVVAIFALLALLRSPLLIAVWRMTTGLLSSLVTGNPAGVFKYALHYMALRLSFLFASAGILAGVNFAKVVYQIFPTQGINEALAGGVGGDVGDASSGSGIFNIGANIIGAAGSVVPAIVMVTMSIILCVIVAWPMFTLNQNGQRRQVNLISLIVTLPFTLAESGSNSIDNLVARLGFRVNRGGSGPVGVVSGKDHKARTKSGIAKAAGTAAAIGAPGIGGAIGTLGSRAAMKAAAGSGAKIVGGKALRGMGGSLARRFSEEDGTTMNAERDAALTPLALASGASGAVGSALAGDSGGPSGSGGSGGQLDRPALPVEAFDGNGNRLGAEIIDGDTTGYGNTSPHAGYTVNSAGEVMPTGSIPGGVNGKALATAVAGGAVAGMAGGVAGGAAGSGGEGNVSSLRVGRVLADHVDITNAQGEGVGGRPQDRVRMSGTTPESSSTIPTQGAVSQPGFATTTRQPFSGAAQVATSAAGATAGAAAGSAAGTAAGKTLGSHMREALSQVPNLRRERDAERPAKGTRRREFGKWMENQGERMEYSGRTKTPMSSVGNQSYAAEARKAMMSSVVDGGAGLQKANDRYRDSGKGFDLSELKGKFGGATTSNVTNVTNVSNVTNNQQHGGSDNRGGRADSSNLGVKLDRLTDQVGRLSDHNDSQEYRERRRDRSNRRQDNLLGNISDEIRRGRR